MSKDDGNGKPKRPLSRSEKFRNYCLGLAALTGLILGTWANLKGEPEAKQAQAQLVQNWKSTVEKVNKLRDAVHKVAGVQQKYGRWIVACQAKQEGWNAAKLYSQLEELRKKNEKNGPRRRKLSDEVAEIKAKLALEQERRRAEAKRKRALMKRTKADQVQITAPMPKKMPKAAKGN